MADDTTYARETARYEELLRETLAASDVRAAFKKVDCEGLRLRLVLDPRHADDAMAAAQGRYLRDTDPAARQRVEQALSRGLYPVDEDVCRKLARTGVLGDTVWPTAPSH